MTRPTYDVAGLTAEGFEGAWSDHNSVGGTFVRKPEFVEVEEPGTGTSGRKLPSTHRTTPVVFVYEQSDLTPEYNDITRNSQDYDATVRMEVVVSGSMGGRSGKEMRDAVVEVLENVREANDAPEGGVFGSDWQFMTTANIDKTPTRFGSHWRAYYDVAYDSRGVI